MNFAVPEPSSSLRHISAIYEHRRSSRNVRGITLNYITQQDVNLKVMSNMVKGVGQETISVNIPFKIVRDRNKSVFTRSETKDYRIVYIKRAIIDNFDTLSYGF